MIDEGGDPSPDLDNGGQARVALDEIEAALEDVAAVLGRMG